MTVADLIKQLQRFAPSAEVVVTWESTVDDGFSVYPGADGVVIIDAGADAYRKGFEGKLRRVVDDEDGTLSWESR